MKRWLTAMGMLLLSFFCAWLLPGTSFAAQVIKQGGAEFSTYINSSTFNAPSGDLKLSATTTKGSGWYVKLCRSGGNCNVTNAIGPYKNGTYIGTFNKVPKGKYYLHFYKKNDGKWVKMSYKLYKE